MKKLIITGGLLIACLLVYFVYAKTPENTAFQLANDSHPAGFIPVDCWFSDDYDGPLVECYQMQVPENHFRPEGRLITFPVVVFRSKKRDEDKAPLLHLGAGGPGAPMYLDSGYIVNSIRRAHDDMSINIGRDLFVIDPRGTGLSRPLLSCQRFVENEAKRFKYNLSIEEEVAEVDLDYYHCIDEFLSEGVDLSAYNSFSIANDIEAMRKAAKVKQWVLLGVSYGSNYAQTVTDQFPESVEAMVLDSATIPWIKLHQDFIVKTTEPYRKLFNYCDSDPDCHNADKNMEQRIWTLFESLSDEPIIMPINILYEDTEIGFVLNGGRLFGALFEGIYGVDIFRDLPLIVSDLEVRKYKRLEPYVLAYSDYMLDRTYGDVSAITHYCVEDRPFIDYDLIARLVDDLPPGFIQDGARLSLEWPKYCERMKIKTKAPEQTPPRSIQVPTLFLHGKFDTATPLRDIVSSRQFFKNHELVTFDLSHSILTSSDCAEQLAAKFIDYHEFTNDQLDCGKVVSNY